MEKSKNRVWRKHRLSTTISAKHWEVLKKHAAEMGTQQKAIELAIEKLENQQSPALTPEDRVWMRLRREIKEICPVKKRFHKALMENCDLEQIIPVFQNELIYVIEFTYRKPIKKCTLKEILDGLVLNGRMSNYFDSYHYTEEGEYYELRCIHDQSLNYSKLNEIMFEELFAAYGAKIESHISETSNFVRVYK